VAGAAGHAGFPSGTSGTIAADRSSAAAESCPELLGSPESVSITAGFPETVPDVPDGDGLGVFGAGLLPDGGGSVPDGGDMAVAVDVSETKPLLISDGLGAGVGIHVLQFGNYATNVWWGWSSCPCWERRSFTPSKEI
jgi:hypothetical protein